MDLIIVPTEGLKKNLQEYTNKEVVVIGDGFDISKAKKKEHKGRANEVVWFGYKENGHSLAPFIRPIRENGLKLKVVSDGYDLPPLNKADKYVRWREKTASKEIASSDFAILPKNGNLKSNNKLVTAWMNGIPAAQTMEEFERFLDADERNKEMDNIDLEPYDINKLAQKYVDIIWSRL